MKQKVYLVCGVPGAGKSWVCEQLEDEFTYLRNDDYIGENFVEAIHTMSELSPKPVLADCPFGERDLRDKLFAEMVKVIPVFIVEKPEVVAARYKSREKKSCPQNVLTRATSIGSRAAEWKAFRGTSEEVLEHLRSLSHA